MERIRLGRFENPVRGLLDLAAAIASAVGLGLLLTAGPDHIRSALIFYASSLVVMFGVSSAYHSVPWTDRWKERMRRADHAAIFLVVAGSVTPIALVALDGTLRAATLTWIWSTTIVGVAMKLREPMVHLGRSVIMQNAIGWSSAVPLIIAGRRLGFETLALLVAAGAVYTVGAILFLLRRPILAPRVFSFHEVFHLLVVAGTALHFHVIVTRILPIAGS
jgi:hemolysin III